MDVVRAVAYFLVLIFFLTLVVWLIFDWVQMLSRGFRPRGVVLVVAEAAYTVTDPPLRVLRKAIPPVRLGAVSLDLGFMLLAFACLILMGALNPGV